MIILMVIICAATWEKKKNIAALRTAVTDSLQHENDFYYEVEPSIKRSKKKKPMYFNIVLGVFGVCARVRVIYTMPIRFICKFRFYLSSTRGPNRILIQARATYIKKYPSDARYVYFFFYFPLPIRGYRQ